MAKQYKRYHEIPVQQCSAKCPGKGENFLKIVLFEDDAKLRSHAVKHLTNKNEPDWIKELNADKNIIAFCTMKLNSIGCFYFSIKTENPPCQGCPLSEKCGFCAAKLENEYLRIIRTVLEEGCSKPSYACFHSKKDGKYAFRTIPDKPLVAMSSLVDKKDAVYNLSTAYAANAGITFSEMLKKQGEKIRNESPQKPIHWCKTDHWTPAPFHGPRVTAAKPKKPEIRTDMKTPKFSIQSKEDWRESLKKMGEAL